MRRIIILLLMSLSLMGCAMIGTQPVGLIYTGVTAPYLLKLEHQGAYEYEILGETEGQATAISILGLVAIGDAGYNEAYKEALFNFPKSDVIIDIASDYHTVSMLGLFTKMTTNISGKAARIIPVNIETSLKERNIPREETSVISQNTESQQVIPAKKSFIQQEFSKGFHGIGFSYINGSGDYDESGFSVDYNFLRYLNRKFNYYAHFSFINMSKSNFTRKDYYWGRPVEYKAKSSTLIFPLYFGLRAKSSGFSQIQSIIDRIPVKGFVPFAEAGAGWYILHRTIEPENGNYPEELQESNWYLGGIGLHFGLGSTYHLMENISLDAGFDYHLLLNEDNANFWQWKIGVTFNKMK